MSMTCPIAGTMLVGNLEKGVRKGEYTPIELKSGNICLLGNRPRVLGAALKAWRL